MPRSPNQNQFPVLTPTTTPRDTRLFPLLRAVILPRDSLFLRAAVMSYSHPLEARRPPSPEGDPCRQTPQGPTPSLSTSALALAGAAQACAPLSAQLSLTCQSVLLKALGHSLFVCGTCAPGWCALHQATPSPPSPPGVKEAIKNVLEKLVRTHQTD